MNKANVSGSGNGSSNRKENKSRKSLQEFYEIIEEYSSIPSKKEFNTATVSPAKTVKRNDAPTKTEKITSLPKKTSGFSTAKSSRHCFPGVANKPTLMRKPMFDYPSETLFSRTSYGDISSISIHQMELPPVHGHDKWQTKHRCDKQKSNAPYFQCSSDEDFSNMHYSYKLLQNRQHADLMWSEPQYYNQYFSKSNSRWGSRYRMTNRNAEPDIQLAYKISSSMFRTPVLTRINMINRADDNHKLINVFSPSDRKFYLKKTHLFRT